MTSVGYARVSSTDQTLDIQLEALTAAGCEKVFSEKQSGTTTAKRTELEACLEWVREGDVLVVTRLDRLARSVGDLLHILQRLGNKGVGFRCLQQPVDTTSSHGKLMLTILGAFAEFETDIRRERQMEGIERAKADGRYKGGRPGKVDDIAGEVRKLHREEDLGAGPIAKRLGVSRSTVYRAAPELWGPTPEPLRRG